MGKWSDEDKMDKVQTWMERFDLAGIGCPLCWFEQIFDSADDEIKDSREYQYMSGLYHGRLLHEAFGGVDEVEKRMRN